MDKKLIFISRSDLRGGAAIVTYRLVEALRGIGVDARMLVCEKMSDSDFVQLCAPSWRIRYSFLKERLKVFFNNGFNRSDLFKVDPASEGLPLWKHPWVRNADAVFLGWVNQGMLSLHGLRKITGLGKPVIWIMHDMWNMTGICHHAGDCGRFLDSCGCCPLLGGRSGKDDMSHKTWESKKNLYDARKIRFVAVSSWLAQKAEVSGLLSCMDVAVIPNPFNISGDSGIIESTGKRNDKVKIIFGAARLDDPIKGLPVLKEALDVIRNAYPEVASELELVTFGSVKNMGCLDAFAIPHRHLGVLRGSDEIRKAYERCDIVVSTSDYETLPGTLVEGQAYGCIPVAVHHGGQGDIIDHQKTGWLASWDDSPSVRAENIAEGIVWAYRNCGNEALLKAMRTSVEKKFSAEEVARKVLGFAFEESSD